MIFGKLGFIGALGNSVLGGYIHRVLNNLLAEDGAFLLTEDGDYILLE